MIDMKPLGRILFAATLLAPLGVWKAIEIVVWVLRHISWK